VKILAPRRVARLAPWLLALALVAAWFGVGCNRKPRLIPASADSLAVRPPDSLAIYVDEARGQWDAGNGDEAADLTARVLLDDLRLHSDMTLQQRARSFIDSLGMGAEIGGSGDVIAVNLFARSDPTGGSWPYLFWRDPAGVHLQAVEGSGLKLLDVIARHSTSGTPQVALLLSRAAARGTQPIVIVWQQPAGIGGWKLQQSLGADSLGGAGRAQFVTPGADSAVLVARTYRPTSGFDECATCPHAYHERRFVWTDEGLRSRGEESEVSAYSTFVLFIHALAVNDRELANHLVTDPSLVDAAIGYQWNESRGLWRVAPGTEDEAREMVFFRGNQEAYRVRFTGRESTTEIAGFQPTSRNLE
jgi:hypothetical protein